MSPLTEPTRIILRNGWQPMDPDAAAYITAVETADGQALEEPVKIAIDNFVLGCKADGIWDAIKASCILSGARTLSGALVPLAGTAPTNYNFVAGDYNRKTGLVGDGSTKYLDSNRLGDADGQDDVHLCTYVSTVVSVPVFEVYVGSSDQNPRVGVTQLGLSNSTGSFFSARKDLGRRVLISPSPTGVLGVARASASEITSRVQGASAVTSSVSETPPPRNYFVFARNNNGAADGFSPSRLAFYSIGESLDLALLDTRVTDLINKFAEVIP